MREVAENVWVGDLSSCQNADSSFRIVHACKIPCHQTGVEYRGNLSSAHPNYLVLEDGNSLFLNMVDMAQPWQPRFADPMFKAMTDFCSKGGKLLFHCNQGESRGPSTALLWLAKQGVISSSSYADAAREFIVLYPNYNPAKGVTVYLSARWKWLMDLGASE